ncbi:MAG: type II toxin-antitoxin system RelE/ParE family toxin [Acidobacteria bacterium]|nr:type II toxin-antitoxin system RelE/ParE family toxin [Acidobacteriota bacterium]MBI3422375.1 type II toxin-antitoxin system RelE/ParE family toxin [Acidobacteriota bacterium]
MNVFRRTQVLADLADCAFYLALTDPAIADRFLEAFEASATRLAQMPYIGVAQLTDNAALFGLRRWPVKGFEKYLIFYLVFDDAIDIIRVLHAAQDIAAVLADEI